MAIINQLIFVYYMVLFGGLSGVGIFTAQYYGKRDMEGVRHTFRYKLWMALIASVLAVGFFLADESQLIYMYLHQSSDGGNLKATYQFARIYAGIILWSVPPILLQMVYASTLRECSETVLPMKAGIVAVFVNLVLNYILIYGKFGAPKLGVAGAAIATVSSRYVEASIILIWVHTHKKKNPYIEGLYKTLRVPFDLVKAFFVKGIPLLVNETLWSVGMILLIQCYSYRGLNVVASLNIANTINEIFNIAFIAMGDAIAIIVGQLLGASKMEEAKDTAYFTLRSGGKTIITFIFDSVVLWGLSIPFAYYLSRYTGVPAVYMYVLIQMVDLLKCVIGFVLLRKGVWMQNIVSKES